MCHWLRSYWKYTEEPTWVALVNNDILKTKDAAWAKVVKIFWYYSTDLVIRWVSFREEISRILRWEAKNTVSIWDTYTLYEYVTIARKSRPNPCNDELADMIISCLSGRQELVYVSEDWKVNIWKSFL
ncbi:MAG: hypothetical protein ACD_3C00035G0003 [uncultured bacterium (gcode 4)]|uniref:Uncharacterized protein n=1 Tax=uncultured bacterium (gcode 4) TaxID=1234023 RepID=K2G0D7_9BACT|nr:MAG: hypothetical protein ACD_3C00035G0003 [uncultured bacterium (gcode 4)]